MLKVKNTHLSEKELGSSSFKRPEDTFLLLKSISENANWSIDGILHSVSNQTIKDMKLRNGFRKYLIAKKYGIKENYISGFSYVSYVSDKCIIIESEENDTSIVLNSQGEVKTDEGKVHINPNSFLCGVCFIAFGRNQQKGKFGLYSSEGDEVLPCIFDSVESKSFPLPLVYEGLQFNAWFGEEPEIEKYSIWGVGKESVYYTYAQGLVKIQFEEFDTVIRLAPGVTLDMPKKKNT